VNRIDATIRGMKRPRILLVPNLTEVEWLIKPQLEEWAEVASFDLPGVGSEPPPEKWDREEAVQRTLRELERLRWKACFIAADAHGIPTAVRAAAAWGGDVLGLALGHARLSDRSQGERAPVNRAVWEAMGLLIKSDYSAFVRTGLTQLTQGSIADELGKRLLERVPMNVAQAAYENIMSDTESIEGPLKELDVPLLFAKHEGCIASNEEGWEDAVAAFPEAETVSVTLDPAVSPEFAEALRTFCEEVEARASTVGRRERS
jgi:hypothetical protein